ncbi:MAG: Xanthine/uracil/vitamin permease [Phycisphaerales bacterium]|nr:Xanthine/uracil/vitamin permease [Phycisphaerales bacterium]
MSLLERTFQLKARGSTVGAELRGAAATFLTMAYILFVNPTILAKAGVPFGSAVACTALAAGVCSIGMGLYANFPIALAAGMGLNATVAFGLAPATGSWQTAMGLVVVDGLLVLVLVLIGLREAILRAIPHDLRLAIGAGIGLFIAFIGLTNAGFVVVGSAGGPPLGVGRLTAPPTLVAAAGLVVTAWLAARRVKGALLFGIAAATGLALCLGVAGKPGRPALPSFEAAFHADVGGAFRGLFGRSPTGVPFVPLLLTLVMVDFFDTLGTVTAIADEAKLAGRDGNFPGLRRVLVVDSLSASVGGLLGASSATCYIESAAGVAEGARTGLHSVAVGALFLLSIFAAPLLGVVPAQATAPALILVGFYMAGQFAKVNFEDYDTAIPAFVTLLTIPLAYSISHGIAFGFLTFVAIKVLSLRFRDVHPLMYLTAAAFAGYLWHGG